MEDKENNIILLFPLVLDTKLAQATKRLVQRMKDETLLTYLASLEEKKVDLKIVK